MIHVSCSSRDAQCIHCDVKYGNVDFLLPVCYGFNNYMQRRDLWRSSVLPWIVSGDFNTIRWNHEKSGGTIPRAVGLIAFNDCIQEAGLLEFNFTGRPSHGQTLVSETRELNVN